MTKRVKYVVVPGALEPQAIVFSEEIPHSTFHRLNPVSAGFCDIEVGPSGEITARAYGRSDSLDIDSNETDGFIIVQSVIP